MNNPNFNTCCFIGHRKVNVTTNLTSNLIKVIEELIINKNIQFFLFGSKSEFNTLCHEIVCNLKNKYNYIKLVKYTCQSESCLLEKDKEKLEKAYSIIYKNPIKLLTFDLEYEHKNKFVAGKASYIERNKAMIDNSNYCVFYYDENYEVATNNKFYVKQKSGTKIAYDYAKAKKKNIINIFEK